MAVYTTGDVIKVTGLSRQSVIRCMDKGLLGCFRVPDSKFRRCTSDDLHKFMMAAGMPMEAFEREERQRASEIDGETKDTLGLILRRDVSLNTEVKDGRIYLIVYCREKKWKYEIVGNKAILQRVPDEQAPDSGGRSEACAASDDQPRAR